MYRDILNNLEQWKTKKHRKSVFIRSEIYILKTACEADQRFLPPQKILRSPADHLIRVELYSEILISTITVILKDFTGVILLLCLR